MSVKVETLAPEPVWCILELMGHVKIAGRLTEEEKFGAKMGRLDIPTESPCPRGHFDSHGTTPDDCPVCLGKGTVAVFVTQFFTGCSVYRISIVSEAVARDQAKRSSNVAPVQPWDYPKALPPARSTNDEETVAPLCDDCGQRHFGGCF